MSHHQFSKLQMRKFYLWAQHSGCLLNDMYYYGTSGLKCLVLLNLYYCQKSFRRYVFGVRSDLHAMHMLGQLCLSMLLVWAVSDVVSPLY